jgi:hypothetical protein
MLEKISIEDLVEQGLVTVEILEPAKLESVCAADVEIEALDWLWPDRFALGKLGLLVGLADVGKGCDTHRAHHHRRKVALRRGRSAARQRRLAPGRGHSQRYHCAALAGGRRRPHARALYQDGA